MSVELPIVGFVGWSGSGKTTLLTRIMPILRESGLRVGAVKHTHHDVEFDTPGKDSYRLRTSGANQMLITSAKRWALYGDKQDFDGNIDIHAEVARMNTVELDIVLVESFKAAAIPKIELHRHSLGKSLLFPNDSNIVAIASDQKIDTPESVTALDLNQPQLIARYIIENFLSSHRIRPDISAK